LWELRIREAFPCEGEKEKQMKYELWAGEQEGGKKKGEIFGAQKIRQFASVEKLKRKVLVVSESKTIFATLRSK
jgi:hypothetical protein